MSSWMGACCTRDGGSDIETRRDDNLGIQLELRDELRASPGSSSGSDSRPQAKQEFREPWEWTPVLELRRSSATNRLHRNYTSSQSREESFAENDNTKYGSFDSERWLEMAENGELDIYTCFGLSNGNTLTPDTKRLISKIAAVSALQLIVPIIMLCLQLSKMGLNFRPLVPGKGFRIMGSVLYLYSLSSMYNNALDECRYKMLKFALEEHLTSGYWWPLAYGEFSNATVSLVLVITLFFIFTNSMHPTDLILNAVAVNFLGGVDTDFVDLESKDEAIHNFKAILQEIKKSSRGPQNSQLGRWTDIALKTMLMVIVCSGCSLAAVFLLAPSPPADSDLYRHIVQMRKGEETTR